ncbi:tenascin-like [Oppia nitens]|uniref:tenascin-like n=1 Tax=Oppia nitens TaxID=1686743 RepID=UPI0023DB7A36|nr:tenascin-like [Oppia nitens]
MDSSLTIQCFNRDDCLAFYSGSGFECIDSQCKCMHVLEDSKGGNGVKTCSSQCLYNDQNCQQLDKRLECAIGGNDCQCSDTGYKKDPLNGNKCIEDVYYSGSKYHQWCRTNSDCKDSDMVCVDGYCQCKNGFTYDDSNRKCVSVPDYCVEGTLCSTYDRNRLCHQGNCTCSNNFMVDNSNGLKCIPTIPVTTESVLTTTTTTPEPPKNIKNNLSIIIISSIVIFTVSIGIALYIMNNSSKFTKNFETIEKLGMGSFGLVLKIKDKRTKQEYAVKIIELIDATKLPTDAKYVKLQT